MAASELTPAPVRVGPFEGLAYGPLPDWLEAALAAWTATGSVPDATILKRGRVFGREGLVLKFYGGKARLRDRLRPSPAQRCAELWEKLLPVPSPPPCAALERRHDGRRVASCLVSEFVVGRTLPELFGHDAAAVAAWPRFLAELVRRRVRHFDLHPGNALWDGERWVLLDLDGISHALRNWRPRALWERWWARTLLALERAPESRALFERFLATAELSYDPDEAWSRVVTQADAWKRAFDDETPPESG